MICLKMNVDVDVRVAIQVIPKRSRKFQIFEVSNSR